jgi:electron transfer flavoprotein alpha subunit
VNAAGRAVGRPLRVAALAKQIPLAESMRLEDGRLVRDGLDLEMNAYCRRAVAHGVTLARETGGTCTALTLGPPSAEDVLREAVAWGADGGLHVCDEAFVGSDTLATARALAAALEGSGPYDLVLVGRNSLDGETGQVGPELAELLGLPFAGGVKRLEDRGGWLRLELELDDGESEVEVQLPAVLSVAERLCDPCKVNPEGRAAVLAERITRIGAAELGAGPWGEPGSPTVVGPTHPMEHSRDRRVLDGPVDEQVQLAVRTLAERGALTVSAARTGSPERIHAERAPGDRVLAVLLEPGRPGVGAELVGAAVWLAGLVGGTVEALAPGAAASEDSGSAAAGADVLCTLVGSALAGDVARAVTEYVLERKPWALLAPSTSFGREVAARAAAATGSGLVGDAIALSSAGDGTLVAAKPAFAGALVADITCRSTTSMVTVRPGVLPLTAPVSVAAATTATRPVPALDQVRLLEEHRNDDVETLARADVVIGVGAGVAPDEYEQLAPLAAVLGAELAATRKVTDKGWAPRARQVGITGRSIAPRLYVAIGLSGKFNHVVGVRSAGTILAVNRDRGAPVFDHCDVGIVADWHEVVPLLQQALLQTTAG